MLKRDILRQDASDHAAAELAYAIRKDSKEAVPTVSVEEAISGRRLLKISSTRNVTRVLFVSKDTTLLNPTQQSLDGYLDISGLFAEVHILILRQGITPLRPVLRVAPNVWIYTAAGKYSWQVVRSGLVLSGDQLEFAGGFRPDLIVALDPFESAVTALWLARKYQRPVQLHITDNYLRPKSTKRDDEGYWRRFLTRFVIPRFVSIRTRTEGMYDFLAEKFLPEDLSVLPRYQDYEVLIGDDRTIDLKNKYRPHIFFMLYIGRLGENSTLHNVLDATRFALQNPRVGLVVLGDGPARSEFERRARALGVERQVVFESNVKDVVPYLNSAQMIIVSDTDASSEEIVLRAAATGIPIIMTETEKRNDVFVDGESAFLVLPGDVQMLANRVDDLLNDIPLRERFVKAGQRVIRDRFHSDPKKYQEAYRASIEEVFFLDDGKVVGDGEGETGDEERGEVKEGH